MINMSFLCDPSHIFRSCTGAVLLDENLKEISLKSPLSLTSNTYMWLRDILQRDTGGKVCG